MTHFAYSFVRKALMAALIATATLAGAAGANADGSPAIMTLAIEATAPVDKAAPQPTQWGPRQCCRRVGVQYVCGPC